MVKKVSNVQVFERLGGGQFSDVYRGNWMVFPKSHDCSLFRELHKLP